VLDIGISQQVMLHGDISAKFVYDLAWDRVTNQPKKLDPSTVSSVRAAVELLKNVNNPWLARNVLMFALEDGPPSGVQAVSTLAYESALSPFFGIGNVTQMTEEDRHKLEAGTSFLRRLFKLPSNVTFRVKDVDVDSALTRKVFIVFNDIEIEMPDLAHFKNRQLVYPPSLLDLMRRRELLTERLVDYDVINTTDDDKKARLAKVLFVGMGKMSLH
jgi:hypothetical protein